MSALGVTLGAGDGETVGTMVGVEVGTMVGAGDGDGVGITGAGVAKYLLQLANPCESDLLMVAVVTGWARKTLSEKRNCYSTRAEFGTSIGTTSTSSWWLIFYG